ncbi:DMT family transporter [Halobacteriales archaeon Cl-PHB]
MARYRNLWLFLVLSAVWGSAFVAIKVGLDHFPPVLFAAIRYDLASVVMLAWAAYAAPRWRPHGQREWAAVAVGASLMIAAYHAFLFVGEQYTTSAAAAIVVSLSPILTTAFARAFLPDSRLTTVGLVGMVLGLVGVTLIARPDPGNLLRPDVLGTGLIFVAAAAFALGSVLTRWLDAEMAIETMEAWSMLGGAALMHVASLAVGESVGTVTWTAEAVLALGYLSLAASAVGFLIYFDLHDRLGPVEINLVSYAAPVFAALVGFLVRGELLDAWTAVGFVTILAGFVLLKRDALRAEFDRVRAAYSRW